MTKLAERGTVRYCESRETGIYVIKGTLRINEGIVWIKK